MKQSTPKIECNRYLSAHMSSDLPEAAELFELISTNRVSDINFLT